MKASTKKRIKGIFNAICKVNSKIDFEKGLNNLTGGIKYEKKKIQTK